MKNFKSSHSLHQHDLTSMLDFHGVSLQAVSFRDGHWSNIDLEGANLQESDWHGVDLSGACLAGADLTAADLRFTNLQKADLKNANLTDARLHKADMAGAVLTDAILSETTNFWGSNITQAQREAAHYEDSAEESGRAGSSRTTGIIAAFIIVISCCGCISSIWLTYIYRTTDMLAVEVFADGFRFFIAAFSCLMIFTLFATLGVRRLLNHTSSNGTKP